MRILQITFRNINNLKGDHHIDFATSPLSTAGIFAIVGPTGSGKSSILDVITLALFNRVPRFARPLSKNEMLGQGSILTHHTNEASALIKYEIKNKKYVSKWLVEKNRNGKLKDYEMSLQDETGQYFDIKKSEVPSKNEAIIGLKYDQFIKSILLSQGEFSRFLKAGHHERGRLLENITGTTIYRKLGALAFVKHKELFDLKTSKEALLNAIPNLTDEERTKIDQEITDSKAKKEKLDKAILLFNEAKTCKEAIIKSKLVIEKLQKESNIALANWNDYAPQRQKIEQFGRIAPVQKDIGRYQQTVQNVVETKKNLESYSTDLKNAKVKFAESIKNMSLLTKKDVDEENFHLVMSQFEKKINLIDNEIKNTSDRGKQIRLKIESSVVNVAFTLDRKMSSIEALQKIKIKEHEQIERIKKMSLPLDFDISKIQDKIQISKKDLKHLDSIRHILTRIAEGQKMIQSSKKTEDTIHHFITSQKPILQQSIKTHKVLENLVSTLQKRIIDAVKIAKLVDFRKDLKDDEPCPLCGSLEHPYTKHVQDHNRNDIQKELDEANEAKKLESDKIEQLSTEITKRETQLNSIKDSHLLWSKKIESWTTDIDDSKTKLSSTYQLNLENIDSLIGSKSEEIDSFEKAISAKNNLQILNQIKSLYEELDKITINYRALSKERKSIFAGTDASLLCNKYQNAFNKSKTIVDQAKKAIEIETIDLKRANEMVDGIKKSIEIQLPTLGFKTIEALVSSYISKDRFEEMSQQKDTLEEHKIKTETQLNVEKDSYQKWVNNDNQTDKTLAEISELLSQNQKERDHVIHKIGQNQSTLNHDNTTRKEKNKTVLSLEKLSKKLETWTLLKQLIGDKMGNQFSNFAQELSLKNLLVFTNRRLKNLSDRYLIDMPKDDGPLMILDQYQGNIQRAVTTLSGGESFLISLALALSLSDMASKNVALESLFIDEGFGTLDHETLEIAISTLEKLQSESQKTVGVISHVSALKERIHVQIKLEKNQQGYSTITIES